MGLIVAVFPVKCVNSGGKWEKVEFFAVLSFKSVLLPIVPVRNTKDEYTVFCLYPLPTH